MQRELPSVPQQLEALLHEWRNFPHLRAAVSSIRQILEHPEDYVRQSRGLPEDVIPLSEETHNGNNPLSGITYLYDISPSQQETPTSNKKEFLQVHFKLCNTISTPRPEDFEPHISIIHASVDDRGEILPMTVEQWELRVKKGLESTKIVLAHPKTLLKDAQSKLKTEIDQLTNSIPTTEPYKTTYYAWTGVQVNILPKLPIRA